MTKPTVVSLASASAALLPVALDAQAPLQARTKAHVNSEAGTPATTNAKPRVKGKARPEAQPYLEGTGYAIRARHKGHEIYLSGYPTAAAINKEVRERRSHIDSHGAAKGRGPDRTTAAQALQDYAMARLRFKKGARQEAVRINTYLRAARLDTLLVTPLDGVAPAAACEAASRPAEGAPKGKKQPKPLTVHFRVTLEPYQDERVIANGLHAHRRAQLTKTAGAQKHRAVLASRKLGDIRRDDMQNYMNAMRDEGVAPATMKLEQSLWKVLFNYAFNTWAWASLKDNAATGLEMPPVTNERKRMMSHDEQGLLDAALLECRNTLVAPVLTLLVETAMRASEPLEHARWGDVDWARRVLCLSDGKGGKRDVALSPAALQVLQDLQPGEPDQRIVSISYNALKKGMERACERAGIKNLHVHDLRRTAATRLALKTGNLFLVKALTGHKTDKMAARYMQVGADDVVAFLHAPEAPPQLAPAVAAELPGSAGAPVLSAPPASPVQTTVTLTAQQLQDLMAQAVAAGLAGLSPASRLAVQAVPGDAVKDGGHGAPAPAVRSVTPLRRVA
jgi:integrase